MKRTALAIVPLLALAACGGGGTETPKEMSLNDAQVNGQRVCRDAVRNTIKSPKTAKFDNEAAKGVPAADGFTVTVTGTVNAENSFGALVAAEYTCKASVTKAGDINAQVTAFKER